MQKPSKFIQKYQIPLVIRKMQLKSHLATTHPQNDPKKKGGSTMYRHVKNPGNAPPFLAKLQICIASLEN
jgi:hypothetical protein